MSSRHRKPQPLRKEKNKREHDNVAHGRKKKICAFKNHTVRLHGSFCRRHLLSDKNTSSHSERLRERPKQGLTFFFCQLTTKASQENRWQKRRQLTRKNRRVSRVRESIQSFRGPFLETPGNLSGPKSNS